MDGDEVYENSAKNNIINLRPIGFVAGAAGCGITFVALYPLLAIGGPVFLSRLDTTA